MGERTTSGKSKKVTKSTLSHQRSEQAAGRKAKLDHDAVATAPKLSKAAPRIAVRRSQVHGLGVVALERIKAGTTIIEYTGERITWKKALQRHPHDPTQPHHTFYFHLNDTHVIDAKYGGNDARWINHSCDPNCEADETDGRVFIKALRDIARGEELNYDYGLVIDARQTAKLKAEYACYCGASNCRGTMLAPKRR